MKNQDELVKKYPKFFDYLQNHEGPIIPIQFGFEVGDGWSLLIEELMDSIDHHCKYKKEIPYPSITQIKEKFGGLRFYYTGGDDYIDGMVSLTENLSYKTCESCGTTKNVTTEGKAWILTLCKKCRYERELKRRFWMFRSYSSFFTWIRIRKRRIRKYIKKCRTKNTA